MWFSKWLRSARTLRRLADGAATGHAEIVRAFVDSKVELGNDRLAWGQYIDRPQSRQVGLYGTSAAVGALRYSVQHQTVRSKAVSYLLARHDSAALNPHDRYEFGLIPKIAGFFRALGPGDLTEPRVSAACSSIVNDLNTAQVAHAGWGYYLGSPNPEAMPTALLLLATDELGLSARLNGRRDAVLWLIDLVATARHKMHPGELALVLHAIRNYSSEFPLVARSRQLKQAGAFLRRQLHVSSVAWLDYLVSYSAPTSEGGLAKENDEYFVMPSALIVLRYLTRHSQFDLVRPAILGRASLLVKRIGDDHMYAQSLNMRAASRENQWAIDLCAELQAMLISSFRVLVTYSYLAGVRSVFSKRVMVYATLLFAAVTPALLGDPDLLVGGFAASIVASLLVDAMTDRS